MFAQRTLAVAVGLLALILAAHAQQPQNQSDRLPRTFTGIWEWGAGGTRERVTLAIDTVFDQGGVLTFTGTQTYHVYDLTEKVTGRIDRKAGKITFTVSDPSKPAVTDGKFEGSISANLDAITCVWMDTNLGARGDLKLTARRP